MTTRDADDRRVLITVLAITVPLSLIVLILLPGGPVFRVFHLPSVSMAPTLPRGSYVLASRASYGFNQHSFDWFRLPLSRRWLATRPKRGDIVVFRLPRQHQTFFIKRVIGLARRLNRASRRQSHSQRRAFAARAGQRYQRLVKITSSPGPSNSLNDCPTDAPTASWTKGIQRPL